MSCICARALRTARNRVAWEAARLRDAALADDATPSLKLTARAMGRAHYALAGVPTAAPLVDRDAPATDDEDDWRQVVTSQLEKCDFEGVRFIDDGDGLDLDNISRFFAEYNEGEYNAPPGAHGAF